MVLVPQTLRALYEDPWSTSVPRSRGWAPLISYFEEIDLKISGVFLVVIESGKSVKICVFVAFYFRAAEKASSSLLFVHKIFINLTYNSPSLSLTHYIPTVVMFLF